MCVGVQGSKKTASFSKRSETESTLDLPVHLSPVHFSKYRIGQGQLNLLIRHPLSTSVYTLVPSLIEGVRVVQGLRVVPAFLYRYSTKN